MCVLERSGDRRREGQFWGGEFRASQCNRWGICDALFSNYFEDLLKIYLTRFEQSTDLHIVLTTKFFNSSFSNISAISNATKSSAIRVLIELILADNPATLVLVESKDVTA